MIKKSLLEITLETITPLFLGGSKLDDQSELRAASFRGALRFWLRALLGGVFGDNLQKVFEAESKVFGSTEHASSVIIRIQQGSFRQKSFSELSNSRRGIVYLFFVARGTKKKKERYAIDVGQNLSLDIFCRAGVTGTLAFQASYASLWLLTHLGGLGLRARRGAGNLQVVQSKQDLPDKPPLKIQADTPDKLQIELENGLKQLRSQAVQVFGGASHPSLKEQPEFDVLHPEFCRIWVIDKTFESWDKALDKFGITMQQFRQGRPLNDRAAFGLPIVSLVSLKGVEHDRRASPMIVRVVKLASGNYALILLRFMGSLLPKDEKLQLKSNQMEKQVDQPSSQILDDFVNHVSQSLDTQLREVSGW